MNQLIKRGLSLLLVFCMIAALGCFAFATEQDWMDLPFADVSEDDWYYDDVYAAYALGLVKGTSDTTFEPNITMTRAMLVTVLYRIIDPRAHILPDYPDSGFSDVSRNQWYTEAVDWAVYCNIANGMDATHFSPAEPVTREQAATFLFRLASTYRWEIGSQKIPWDNGNRADLSSYPDLSEVHAYAVTPLQWAVANGIIKGTTLIDDDTLLLAPSASATRAQVCALVVRFVDYIDNLS